jgi:hypothetical protein
MFPSRLHPPGLRFAGALFRDVYGCEGGIETITDREASSLKNRNVYAFATRSPRFVYFESRAACGPARVRRLQRAPSERGQVLT